MIQLVVDSSVLVKWLNQQNEKNIEQAELLLKDVRYEKVVLAAPELVKYEIGNVLLVSKQLALSKAKETLEFFFSLPIIFVPETQALAQSSYRIGHELKITYYDAAFLSVAEYLDAPLVTDNIKHQGKSTKVKVISLANYSSLKL